MNKIRLITSFAPYIPNYKENGENDKERLTNMNITYCIMNTSCMITDNSHQNSEVHSSC